MFNLPKDFQSRMRNMLGDEYEQFLASYENRISKSGHVRQVRTAVDVTQFVDFKPLFSFPSNCFATAHTSLGDELFHKAGAYYMQEPSAMLPVLAAGIESGATVLDMCAAAGGKSSQIASVLGGSGWLVSNEIDRSRVGVLKENLRRLGYANVTPLSMHASAIADFGDIFDVVVVDAPCSGEGMFSRSEAAAMHWSEKNVLSCAERQQYIIDSADICLKVGGKLVYSTCTFSREENEEVVRYIMDKGYELVPIDEKFTPYVRATDFGYRCYPHIFGRGQFFAVLRKVSQFRYPVSKPRQATGKDTTRVSRQDMSALGEIFDVSGLNIHQSHEQYYTQTDKLPYPLNFGTVLASKPYSVIVPTHALFKVYGERVRQQVQLTAEQATEYYSGSFDFGVRGHAAVYVRTGKGDSENYYLGGVKNSKRV